MKSKGLFDVISPIMVGPSSSHTAGAIRLGLMARTIYNAPIKEVHFTLYNSFAQTGKGHGTDKGLLAGIMGFHVDDVRTKNIFDITTINYEYSFAEDLSRHPNSVDIKINEDMTISGCSIGAGEIRITEINGFSVNLSGQYHTILLMYKDKPGMISTVSKFIQDRNINIASLHCDRNEKGGVASMYLALDAEPQDEIVDDIKNINDVYFVTKVRKLD